MSDEDKILKSYHSDSGYKINITQMSIENTTRLVTLVIYRRGMYPINTVSHGIRTVIGSFTVVHSMN